MEFAEPLALVFLIAPLIVFFLRRERPGLPFAGLSLAGALPRPRRVRWIRYLPLVRVVAILLLIVAASRPREGLASTVVPAEGIDIALALDVSGSMVFARFDEGMNRLEGAKTVIREFIAERPDDRIGLAVFQQSAIPVAPPTLDHEALDQIVEDLRTGLLSDGTAIGLGLGAAVNLLADSPAPSRVAILLTDGIHNTGDTLHPLDAAELARALDIRVYTVGIAGEQTGGGRVDDDLLMAMAEATGGRYYRAESFAALSEVYEEISSLETFGFEREQYEGYREYGPWLAAAAVALLVLDTTLRATVFRRVSA